MKLTLKFKIILLLLAAFIPRVVNLGGHGVFVDEITWMSRCKDVYATARSLTWNPNFSMWWLTQDIAEAIGLPVTFLCGVSMVFLSPGYSHYSLNVLQDFVAARVPVALIGSLYPLIFFLLVRKFVNEKHSFLAALLFSLDPVAIGLSRWLQHDMALVTFSTLSLFLYLVSTKKTKNSTTLIVASALCASLAILTKPQGFIVPLTILTLLFVSITTKQKLDFKVVVLWTILAGFFTVALFPYLWKNPIVHMLTYLKLQIWNVGLGNLTYFNGQITNNPPWYYYFAIFPFRIPESILLGLIVGIYTLVKKSNKFLKSKTSLMIVIYSLFFLVLIMFSDKKLGIRYLFGVWPYIYLVSAYGILYLEKIVRKPFKKIYWLIIFTFPIMAILKFYPIYYLYHNNLITPKGFQNIESVGYCDSVKEAINYLEPRLYHGVKIMLMGCDAAINYYTGFTVQRVYRVKDKPDFVIEEVHNAQKQPELVGQIEKAGYVQINEIKFRGIVLAKVYKNPSTEVITN